MRDVRSISLRGSLRGAVRLPHLLVLVAAYLCMGSGDCKVPTSPSKCGASTQDNFYIQGNNLFSGVFPTTSFIDGGRAFFAWDHELSGICSQGSDSDTRSAFPVSGSADLLSPDVTVDGRVFHAAFAQPYAVRLTASTSSFSAGFLTGSVDVGLKQGNPDGGPATITVEARLSFNSSGNFQTDLARARAMVTEVGLNTDYKLPK